MPDHTAGLLALLARHGVTRDVLELWVHILESQANGSVTFHHARGHLGKCDIVLTGKATALSACKNLTKVLAHSIVVATRHSEE
jgi:hypothetical protein